MIRGALTTCLIPFLTSFLVCAQNCPDDINNSPGNSGNTAEAIVYDSDGDVLQTITCDATGNSGQIDCDLDSYNFPSGSYITIDFSNGPNTTTCFYDADGELIEDNIELPVDFGGLTVENNGVSNQLHWVTFSERNNSFFKLEYSSDGVEWQEIEKVDGAGNSNTTLEYSTAHLNYKSGINYYRISQQDIDGELTFLAITSIENGLDFEINLNSGKIEVFSDKKIKMTHFSGLDGKIINQNVVSNNNNTTSIDCQSYNRGLYILQVEFADGSIKKKKIFLN